jgi:hypothetical protein
MSSRMVGIAAIVLFAGLVACPAGAAGQSSSSRAAGAGSVRAKAGADWQHALQVVADLRAHPPTRPLVLMMGNSIVRESTMRDSSWAAQVHQQGGPSVAAHDLGSSNQSFAQDLKLVPYLPAAPTIVFIGVDVVRFASPPSDPAVTLPAPGPVPPGYDPHRYSSAHILAPAKKRGLVADWMRDRFPVFSRYYSYDLGQLEKLIKACLAKGLHPVLLDTPRNTAIIGHAFDKPVTRYHADCRALAARHGIPFVEMVDAARFANTDFYDLWHLVQPGRVKWQLLLSNETVAVLKRYGMG